LRVGGGLVECGEVGADVVGGADVEVGVAGEGFLPVVTGLVVVASRLVESLEQIEMWRASTTFGEGVAKIRELLDGFEPHTMDPVVTIGG